MPYGIFLRFYVACLYGFDICATTFVVLVWKCLPMVEVLEVCFHNSSRLNTLDVVFDEIWMLIRNDDGIESSVLVVWSHSNQKEVKYFVSVRL